MSKSFSQLLLHSPTDRHPRTWTCVKGKGIPPLVRELEKQVLNATGWTRWKLSEKLASKFDCSHNTIEQIFRRTSGFYPLSVILKLAKLSKNGVRSLRKIDRCTEYIKVNSASAKPVKVIRRVTTTLAKILGAFMADGSLNVQIVIAARKNKFLEPIKIQLRNDHINYSYGKTPSRKQYYVSTQVNRENTQKITRLLHEVRLPIQTHYSIELTDAYRDNVEAFLGWIKHEFNAAPSLFGKKKNAWRVTFSNKIIARYFMQFFGVAPGPKTYTAHEPLIIQRAPLAIRKSFAKGVLMFDGCVTNRGKIAFTTVSGKLRNSISDIWKMDGIKFGVSLGRKKEFNLYTYSQNQIQKLLEYFEEGTQKWKLLNWLSGDIRYTPTIHNANPNSISIEKVLDTLKEIKKCDAFFLRRRFACSHTTIRVFLKILQRQKRIGLSQWPRGIYKDGVEKSAAVLLTIPMHNRIFRNLQEKFGEYQNCAAFLEILKATLSAWKVRKNRIPLEYLEKLCGILDFDYDKVLLTVREVDREIAEVI